MDSVCYSTRLLERHFVVLKVSEKSIDEMNIIQTEMSMLVQSAYIVKMDTEWGRIMSLCCA